MNSIIFIFLCYIFKLIIESLNIPVVSDVDQLINKITEKKPIKYISNGVELKNSLKIHYFNILDMENGKIYDREMISKQVIKQHSFYNDDVKIGYKTKHNTNDIHLAEDYILDYYEYVVHLN